MTTEPSYTAFMLYRMIDPHVYETNRSVLRKVYKRIKKVERKRRDKRDVRKALYKGVLECHKRALDLVRQFRL